MKNIIIIFLVLPFLVSAQSHWKRKDNTRNLDLELFHSIQTANLPTTETLKKGDFMFEISHRFGKISDGYDALYGFDGPVTMRIALNYGLTNHIMIGLGRSDILDNLELNAKIKLWQIRTKFMPSVFAIRAGFAVNSEPAYNLKAFDTDYNQYYLQLVYNIMLMNKKLGIGLVPTYVGNSYIFAARKNLSRQYTLSLGTYYQYYFNRIWSVWAEYSPVFSGWNGTIFSNPSKNNRSYNSLALGFAIETGGHIFHIFVTNNNRLNTVQYIVGSNGGTDKNDWRLGFSITREL